MTPDSPRLLGDPRSLCELDDLWPTSRRRDRQRGSKAARPASPTTVGGIESSVFFSALWNPSQHREGGGFRVQGLSTRSDSVFGPFCRFASSRRLAASSWGRQIGWARVSGATEGLAPVGCSRSPESRPRWDSLAWLSGQPVNDCNQKASSSSQPCCREAELAAVALLASAGRFLQKMENGCTVPLGHALAAAASCEQ
jgi:hypothetical protein